VIGPGLLVPDGDEPEGTPDSGLMAQIRPSQKLDLDLYI